MEDLVGIEFTDKKHGDGAVITWGKIFEKNELLEVVKNGLTKYGAKDIEIIDLCNSLTQIKEHPYFYECLIKFIQEPIPSGENKYNTWANKKRKALKNRQDIYFNGFKNRYYEALERIKNGVSYHDED